MKTGTNYTGDRICGKTGAQPRRPGEHKGGEHPGPTFSSDPELVESSEVIKNVSISDHNFVIATLNRESIQDTEARKANFCSTDIPLYNLCKGSTEDWNKARADFESRKYREDITVEDLMKEIIKNLEISVKNNFKIHLSPSQT